MAACAGEWSIACDGHYGCPTLAQKACLQEERFDCGWCGWPCSEVYRLGCGILLPSLMLP